MVQLTRIYTKGGDRGKTSLGDGKRVFKNDLRLEAIGGVDEVNAWVGLCQLYISPAFSADLNHIQHDLFDVGADLCVPTPGNKLKLQEAQVLWVEEKIDILNASLAPLNSFVLPGGSKASAYLHGARTVARRAERALVALAQTTALNPFIISYINRLSDYFFVLGRFENNKGSQDILWVPGKNQL